MTTPDRNYEQDADALEALAGGVQESAAETEDLVNPLGEPAHDRFTPLVLPSELGLPIDDPPPPEPAEAGAAPAAPAEGDPAAPAGSVSVDGLEIIGTATADPPADNPQASGGAAGGLFLDEVASSRAPTYAASSAPRYAPPRPTGFAALFTTSGLTKAAARRRSRLFRIVMIPALIVVGLTLVASCFVTLIMLLVGNTANSIGAGRLYIHQFGKYIVIAGLPLGAILLMGAWLFFMELQKLKPIADEEDEEANR